MFREGARENVLTPPIRVGDLGDDLATLFQCFQHRRDIELAAESRLDSNFNVVEIDKYCDL